MILKGFLWAGVLAIVVLFIVLSLDLGAVYIKSAGSQLNKAAQEITGNTSTNITETEFEETANTILDYWYWVPALAVIGTALAYAMHTPRR